MPLVFSPLSDEVIALPPRGLYPRHGFLMRQIGDAPQIDIDMAKAVSDLLEIRGYSVKDADASTGGKDYLERILGLIRGTGFTIAVFSHQTRPTALANIMLELGFAAMCGKPLMIVKSRDAHAPSDLTRTDWIDYDFADPANFAKKVGQALDEIEALAQFEEQLLDIALDAQSMDCAVALERAQRAFLLSGQPGLIDKAEAIRDRIAGVRDIDTVADLHRLHDEVAMFVKQGRNCQLRAA
jgi:hypothetical protein